MKLKLRPRLRTSGLTSDFRPQTSDFLVVLLAFLVALAPALSAQFQMPDPKQMSGIPRPVDDLPNGSLSVRLIRGDLTKNIVDFPVELHVGDKVQTVKTDDAGRAQFDKLPPGATLKAVAVVDGERLESQEFPAPAQGGIRLMLVATDKEKEAQAAAAASAPPITGQVSIGGESRFVMEPGDEVFQLYYVLSLMNTGKTPVNPPSVFMFDMPTGAVGTTLLDGSSPKASVNGTRVRVEGPFPPGETLVQVGAELPVTSGSLEITQRFPATFERLALIVKKVGDMKLTSPQVTQQQDMVSAGETYIAGGGQTVPAGQPITFVVSGLAHHSAVPHWTALGLAAAILIIGAVAASKRKTVSESQRAERARLTSRREKLLQDLVRLEADQRLGRVDAARYATRREQLLETLEQIYGALDTDDTGPEPADRSGVAA